MEASWKQQNLAADGESDAVEVGFGELAVVDPHAGFGACSKCSCQSYMGSGDLCENCQHNYSFHW
jgi:hypothetical protein